MSLYLLLTWMLCCAASAPAAPAEAAADSSGLAIVLDRTSYVPGDTVQVTVTNRAGETALFAFLCDAFVEGRLDSTWATVVEPDCSRVRVRPTRVAAGAAIVVPYRLEPDRVRQLAKYSAVRIRLRYQLEGNGGYRVARSAEFKISAN